MPHPEELRVLRKEIATDLESITPLMAQLATARESLPARPDQERLAYIGFLLHSIYTGWESAMRRIAVTFENRLDPSQWHAQLLMRMTFDLLGVRPALLGEEQLPHLRKIRSFRHFFRHNYAAPLELDELKLVLKAYDAVAPEMEKRFRQFLTKIESIAQSPEED